MRDTVVVDCRESGVGVGCSPISALLGHPARELVSDRDPRLRPVVIHKLQELLILLQRPPGR